MRVSPEILAIIALFVTIVIKAAKGQATNGTSVENSTLDPKKTLIPSTKIDKSTSQNATTKAQQEYWMSRMGRIEPDLVRVQAFIVKDEEIKGACDPAKRRSKTRYLMCAGSILNHKHVLTSATCVHEATHIRHNIRAAMSVVVAPLRLSIQVIRVTNYQVHPYHNTDPYSSDHLKHNIAILKLACRINKDNYFGIELPTAPMQQTCSEENCIVAVYRRTGKSSYVMYQTAAPNIPFLNRRRKETSSKDMNPRRSRDDIIEGAIRLERSKRRLADRPVFVGKHKLAKRPDNVSPTSTSETITPKTIESISQESKNSSFTSQSSLSDEVSKALKGSKFGNETIKSFVVRSSTGLRSCAQTGSAVMLNNTQAALVAIPCDDRQASSRWFYSDIYGNLDWIHQILQDWKSPVMPGVTSKQPAASGNFSGCSTCIFNFFIEIGCKDKNQCGKNFTSTHASHLPGQEPPKSQNNVVGGRRKNSGCSGSNSVGIEVGLGQGCEKTDKDTRTEYGGKSAKLADSNGKDKHLSLADNNAGDDVPQVEQPVTDNAAKTAVINYNVDKEKYPIKDNSQVSGVSQTYKTPINNGRTNRERVSNEIALQNIESDSADWVSEVEKGLDLSSQVKRELIKSRRTNGK